MFKILEKNRFLFGLFFTFIFGLIGCLIISTNTTISNDYTTSVLLWTLGLFLIGICSLALAVCIFAIVGGILALCKRRKHSTYQQSIV